MAYVFIKEGITCDRWWYIVGDIPIQVELDDHKCSGSLTDNNGEEELLDDCHLCCGGENGNLQSAGILSVSVYPSSQDFSLEITSQDAMQHL